MYKKAIIAITILYIALITTLSVVNLSGKIEPVPIANIDKIVHFCFYFAMNVLLILVVKVSTSTKSNQIKWLIGTTLVTILYSVGIEVVQIYVGRSFEFKDIIANSLGAVCALFVMNFFKGLEGLKGS